MCSQNVKSIPSRVLGKSGEHVPILGFGCMRFPVVEGKNNIINRALAEPMLLEALDAGVDYLDTAYPYHSTSMSKGGDSEPFLGDFIKKEGIRDKVRLVTKLPTWLVNTAEDSERLFSEQLDRLKTDRLDFYLIHAINWPTWEKMKRLGVLEFIDKIKKDGRALHVGFSFHGKPDEIVPIMDDYPDFEFVQVQYNYVDLDYQGALSAINRAKALDMGVIVMEPLKGGKLGDKLPHRLQNAFKETGLPGSPAENALKWIWNQKDVHILLSGMSTLDQVKENISWAMEAKTDIFGDSELAVFDDLRKRYKQSVKVDCTLCKYCLPACPEKINIPHSFMFYNDVNVYLGHLADEPDRSLAGEYPAGFASYDAIPESHRADKCISCGACVSLCPQGIDIPGELQKVAKTFA